MRVGALAIALDLGNIPLEPLGFVLVLAAVHILGTHLLDILPRPLLSMAGGIAAGYAIVHVLPLLATGMHTLQHAPRPLGDLPGKGYFALVLAGFLAYYGIEHLVTTTQEPERRLFWVQVTAFALYNVLIGYLVTEPKPLGEDVELFVVALAFHFLTTDHGLRRHHPMEWCHEARWALAGALLLGFVLGATVTTHPVVPVIGFAFLAGGILFNALNEELPPPARAHLIPFGIGALLYAALLVLV